MGWTKNILFFSLAIAIVSYGCSRGGVVEEIHDPYPTGPPDTTMPSVDLKNPTDNQTFKSGDVIKVEGRVTDNSLYRGSIRITNDADGSLIKEQLYEIHGYQLYDFSVDYQAVVSTTVNYTVTVKYEDHALNAGIKSVKVVVNP